MAQINHYLSLLAENPVQSSLIYAQVSTSIFEKLFLAEYERAREAIVGRNDWTVGEPAKALYEERDDEQAVRGPLTEHLALVVQPIAQMALLATNAFMVEAGMCDLVRKGEKPPKLKRRRRRPKPGSGGDE